MGAIKRVVILFLVITMLVTPLHSYAFYIAPFSVQFESGSSRLAGDESTLAISVPAEASYRYIAIDLGTSGFAPTCTAVLWMDSWPKRTELECEVVVTGGLVEVFFTKVPDNAWSLNVSVDVRNPLKAVRVNTGLISVKAGATAGKAEAIPAMGSFLDIGLKVVANISKGVVGKQELVQFRVLEGTTVCEEPLRFTLKRNGKALYSGVLPSGNLDVPLYFYYDTGKHSGNYTLDVSKVSQAQIKGTLTLPVEYDLAVTVPKDAVFESEAVISGYVRDGNGRAVAGVPVSIVNKGAPYSPVASTTTANDGSFTLRPRFLDAAEHAISISGTEYRAFVVHGLPLEVTVVPFEVASNAVSTAIELKVMFEGQDVSQAAEVKIIGPDGKTVLDWTTGNPWGKATSLRKIDLGKEPLIGEYTVLARYEDVDGGETTDVYDGTGSTSFAVRSSTVVVTASKLDGDLTSVGPNSIAVKVTDVLGQGVRDNPKGKEIQRVRFTISGAVAEESSFDSAATGASFDPTPAGNVQKTLPMVVTQYGRVTVQGEVYLADGTKEPFSYTLTTNGWVVETSQIIGLVGNEVVLRAVVKTPEGTPVNHAKVVWQSNRPVFQVATTWGGSSTTSTIEVDGLESNVQNGVYEARAKLLQADDRVELQVLRARDNATRAYTYTSIREGHVYQLKSTPNSLIATLDNQLLGLSYQSPQGRVLSSDAMMLVKGPGVEVKFVTSVDWHTPQFVVSPNGVGEIRVEGGPQDKSRFAPLVIPVTAPRVEHNVGAYVTENMWQTITLRGQDKPFGSALPVYIRISSEGALVELQSLTGAYIERVGQGVERTFTTYASTEHSFRLMPWAPLAEEVAPVVRIEASYNRRDWVVVHEAPVKPVVITASPEELYVGASQQLMVTVTDANGAPYAGRVVDVRGVKVATDAQGKASVSIRPTGTHLMPIAVSLDRILPNGQPITATVYVASKLLE